MAQGQEVFKNRHGLHWGELTMECTSHKGCVNNTKLYKINNTINKTIQLYKNCASDLNKWIDKMNTVCGAGIEPIQELPPRVSKEREEGTETTTNENG